MCDQVQVATPAPDRAGVAWKAMLVLGFLVLAGWLAPTSALAQDVPKGTVAFFEGISCPPGWGEKFEAKGRLLVATISEQEVGLAFGVPLANREDRQHKHRYFSYISLASKNICAACSCCNDQGAAAGLSRVDGDTDSSTTKLPFIQYLVCEKA